MGNKIWSFDRTWKNGQIQKSHDFLRNRIATRQNDTCVIVCNGPSLNAVDPLLLRNFDVIACNAIFLSEAICAQVDFYTCVNYLVAEQYAPKINQLNLPKVLPWWLAYCVNESENIFSSMPKAFQSFRLISSKICLGDTLSRFSICIWRTDWATKSLDRWMRPLLRAICDSSRRGRCVRP